jgi:hypothetical protein
MELMAATPCARRPVVASVSSGLTMTHSNKLTGRLPGAGCRGPPWCAC